MLILPDFNFIVTEKKKMHSFCSYDEALQLYNVNRQKVKSYSVNESFSICTTMSLSNDCGKQKSHTSSHVLDHITEEFHQRSFSL